jgi:hypothetical protein
MEVVTIDSEVWQQLNKKLEAVEKLIQTVSEEKKKTIKTDWIPLKEFLSTYNISNSSWYDRYKKKIKHRNDGLKVWVHKPSMEKYLMEKAIN